MLLLIDKPKGITSHDVIYQIRKITSEKRVGHAGTLDPNASGLLIVGVGRKFTKKLGKISKNTKKEYIAEIYIGKETKTNDSEGEVVSSSNVMPSNDQINSVLEEFKGKQKQTPPAYSAVKIKGKKAYELARKGKKVHLKPKEITIYSIKVLKYEYPLLEIKVLVSSGTYIRALARDVGKILGTGAYLSNLKRTKIGKYKLIDAKKISQIARDFETSV